MFVTSKPSDLHEHRQVSVDNYLILSFNLVLVKRTNIVAIAPLQLDHLVYFLIHFLEFSITSHLLFSLNQLLIKFL